MNRLTRVTTAWLTTVLLLPGCGVPFETTVFEVERLKERAATPPSSLLWLFPGIVGPEWELGPAYRGFRDAGFTGEPRFFQWPVPSFDIFRNLQDTDRNRQQAAAVAAEIAEFHALHPEVPVDLIGYSGGGALAVMVVEALPADVRVRHVLLAQSALSPFYDLTTCLTGIDGYVINFYCPTDLWLSGIFTTIYGTMDRERLPTAGLWGFWLPRAVPDAALRPRLVQIGWDEHWRAAGHGGDHMAILSDDWNMRIAAPFIIPAADRRVEFPYADRLPVQD